MMTVLLMALSCGMGDEDMKLIAYVLADNSLHMAQSMNSVPEQLRESLTFDFVCKSVLTELGNSCMKLIIPKTEEQQRQLKRKHSFREVVQVDSDDEEVEDGGE